MPRVEVAGGEEDARLLDGRGHGVAVASPMPSGFSTNRCLSALAASLTRVAWSWVWAQMSTASMARSFQMSLTSAIGACPARAPVPRADRIGIPGGGEPQILSFHDGLHKTRDVDVGAAHEGEIEHGRSFLALGENAAGWTRTSDRRIRNPMLYPTELRLHGGDDTTPWRGGKRSGPAIGMAGPRSIQAFDRAIVHSSSWNCTRATVSVSSVPM